MQFFASAPQSLFPDLLLLPQEGSNVGPTGRPPNGYALLFNDHAVLFDAPFSWMIAAIGELADEGKPPSALVLSHADLAQQGDAFAELRSAYNLPVFLHPADASGDKAARASVPFEDPRTSDAFQRDQLKILEIPGHTPGSIMLHSPRHGGVLLTGDSAVGPGPKQDRSRPRLQRPKMETTATERFAARWQEILRTHETRSVLPLHGLAYLNRDDLSDLARGIWDGEPMDPSARA